MDNNLSEGQKQELYRTARFTDKYKDIWVSVGKCVFCDLNEKYVFYEENGVVMTISLFAYIDGHFMILPRRHVKSTKELTELEWETIRKFSYIAQKIIKKVHKVAGMQLIYKDGIAAQSTVSDHLHFHAVPFDTPDLNIWNYRNLQNTPLQNVELYKKARKEIVKSDVKFETKYKQDNRLPVVCDVIILNKNNEVLLQERKKFAKLVPDYLTPPGGTVDNFDNGLEAELAREVKEETGFDITGKKLKLLSARPGQTRKLLTTTKLNVKRPVIYKFLQVTYMLDNVDPKVKLKPDDDCKDVIWIPIKEAMTHERISPEIRESIKAVYELTK